MLEAVSINGRLVAPDQAFISIFGSGFLQGVGLFETMTARGGRVFRLDRHLARLANSAHALAWNVSPDPATLAEQVRQTVAASRLGEARVRLTVTTGTLRPLDEGPPQLTQVITVAPRQTHDAALYQKGVTVAYAAARQCRHDITAGHKTTSYFARLAALRGAHALGAFEAIWLTPENRVAEGSISSLFLVVDDELLTAPLDTPVLPGISRAAIMELAVELGIPVREVELVREDLAQADEVFLTNVNMGVMPVVRVGREPVGDEKVGDLTRQLHDAFVACVARECGEG